jgi:hypothetical protein
MSDTGGQADNSHRSVSELKICNVTALLKSERLFQSGLRTHRAKHHGGGFEQDNGEDIEVMNEDDFLRCLEAAPPIGSHALLRPVN